MSATQQPHAQAAPAARQYLQCHGLAAYVQDAATLVCSGSSAAAEPGFLARYLTAVVCGEHVAWRHYGFVAATHHNRQTFLATAQRSLAAAGRAGRLSLGDCLSLLQLLCPDFPLAAVRAAWSPALALQSWLDQQQGTADGGSAAPSGTLLPGDGLVQLRVFLQCLSITFTYEHFLLAVRRGAFDAAKKCIGLEALEAAMSDASAAAEQAGWPVPPAQPLKQAVSQACRAGTFPCFIFDDLIRALCGSQALVRAVRGELLTASAAATAVAAAVMPPPDPGRPSSSSDEA